MSKWLYNWMMAALLLNVSATYAGVTEQPDTVWRSEQLQEVSVSAQGLRRARTQGLANADFIGSGELLRAACCNLGESFTTNPSVDVSYDDAATGARQIKLLGLSGTYVQMLTENIPNYRGAAAPYALGYIPGPWMQSIQVSKGASSVKNGYESLTGQINVEFKKPQATPFADANLFCNTKGKWEANLGGNLQLGRGWSTALLGHYELQDKAHDDNGDAYMLADGTPSWDARYKGYEQLGAQLTRFFRHWSIYVGGENITDRRQRQPIIDAANPYGPNFDATMVWGPVHGAIYYIGVRLNWEKI